MTIHKNLGAALLFIFCGSSMADWALSSDDSRLSFTFVKKEHIVEAGTFTQLSGSVNNAGQARVEVALTTVNTLIEIRDQRLQELLFETKTFPVAVYEAHLDPGALKQVLAGDSGGQQIVTLNGHLDLHGVKKALNAEVILTKTGPNSINVDSARPVVINTADFGLVPGVDKLQALASLPHIAHSVPVNFHLVFRAE